MVAKEWLARMSRITRCPMDVLESIFHPEQVERYLVNAESESDFEDALEVFGAIIETRIEQLKKLENNLYAIPYERVKGE